MRRLEEVAVPRTGPFDEHAAEYDGWFDRNPLVYESELRAVRALLPPHKNAVEVGVGTGRFAAPLGIGTGVEPSHAMAAMARERGIAVVDAVAEDLPFVDGAFDLVLMVTTVCFLDDVGRAFSESHRVLEPGGHFIVGFLDREAPLGSLYEARKGESDYYRIARFVSSEEVSAGMERAGFGEFAAVQTIFESPEDMEERSPVEPGHGRGLFVVVRGRKSPGASVSGLG
jgi:SAM-dependent methyltransferase